MIVFNLPITGTLQPKVGTINLFPHYGLFELCLLKNYEKIIFIVFCLSFYSSSAWAGPCDTTVSGTTTSTLNCDDDDDLIVSGSII